MASAKVLYFDFNATTPVDPRVLHAMLPYFSQHFGNSLSDHTFGWAGKEAVEKSRKQVAHLLGCEAKEIFFTSGATESNNWVLQRILEDRLAELTKESGRENEKVHLISSRVEHNSILNCLKTLGQNPRVQIDWVEVDSYGRVKIESVKKLIRPETALMSFMWANNEIGSFNPIKELSEIAKAHKIYLHSDATQAVGKTKVNLSEIPVDLLSFSAHKFYGPKGIGGLFIRSKDPRVSLSPWMMGGGHEEGMRSGTLNVPAIVGMGEACELIGEELSRNIAHIKALRTQFIAGLKSHFPNIRINSPDDGAVNTLNVSFLNYVVPPMISGLAVSRGSACSSVGVKASHVLREIGFSTSEIANTLRISMGRDNTEEQVKEALRLLSQVIKPQSFQVDSPL